jgi:hypothetical protein
MPIVQILCLNFYVTGEITMGLHVNSVARLEPPSQSAV